MARGKDAPIVTGGQLDPYVASSMQQRKAGQENRLLAAMREQGATERSQLAASTQLESQGMQNQATLAAQAAQTEADDRRAAEAERSKREDQKFAKAMHESSQVFQAKQDELQKEHDIAMTQGDRDYAEKIRDKQESLRRFEIEKQIAAQERNTNALLSIIKGSMQRESAKEKAMTVLNQEAEKFDKDKEVYERTKSRVVEKASTDKRLDLPIVGNFKVGHIGSFGAMPGVAPPIGKELIPGTQADPMGVLQDELNRHQTKVSIEQMAPKNINQLEDALQEGSVSAEEVRSALSVLEGMKDVLDQKRKDNPLREDESAYDFWNESYQSVIDMRDAVEGLANSQKKVKGSDQETVGSRVQYALGVIRNNSLGGRASRLRELAEGNFIDDAVLDEMTKSIQVPTLWPIDSEMSDYDRELREVENAMLTRLYPELGGIE